MKGYAILFPGQGSQKPGMGKEFYDSFDAVKEVFRRAERALQDCSVTSLCFEADDEELKKTENTQPALFTLSYAIYRVLAGEGFGGSTFAGHSLGEYTAVAAAGFLNFEDTLRIVRQRGLLMKDCDPEEKGGMAAIIGVDVKAIEKVCAEIGEVYPANFNSPNQIVISGMKEKVQVAAGRLKVLGAKKVVILNVGGPFHSPYMKEAQVELSKELDRVQWRGTEGCVISNVTGRPARSPEDIKENLLKQLSSPVLWCDSLNTLLAMGYRRFIESGPGTVLKGLFRGLTKDAEVFSAERPQDLQALRS